MAIRALLVFLLAFAPTIFGFSPDDIIEWCNKTPNPKPCEYFLSTDTSKTPIKSESDFYKISTHLALARALRAHSHTGSLGIKCRNEKEKAAWEDCLKLYEYTISWLNKTTSPKCTKYDAQTWLSTALTNLDTCRAGFVELGVEDYVFPLMSNNVSKLISNILSIKNVPYPQPSYKDNFPAWVRPGDRKLLQSSTPPANIVVAQDRSGNYTTVAEAISAASNRSGSERFVIYIKAGVYSENVEIGTEVKNIMLVGDGIEKTIITGSKSVGGGTTTFRSATVAVLGDGF